MPISRASRTGTWRGSASLPETLAAGDYLMVGIQLTDALGNVITYGPTALGMTADELRTELQGGTTIAELATEKGVELSTVTDAMLAAEKEHLAEEVTAGKITQAQADERLSGAADRITARVNGEKPERPADAPADTPADAPTTEG